MTRHKADRASSSLDVIIPVKSIDSAALGVLQSLALAAPKLRFIAVGQVVAKGSSAPNLTIIDVQCGIYEAMNIGAKESDAQYLLFMGIDDELIASNVGAALDRLSDLRGAALIALPYMVGKRLIKQTATGGAVRSYHHQGVLFARQLVLQLDGYSTRFRLHSDLDLMFRMQSHGRVAALELPLVVFSTTGITTSGRLAHVSIREFWTIYGDNSVRRLSVPFVLSVALAAWYGVRYRLRGLLRRR